MQPGLIEIYTRPPFFGAVMIIRTPRLGNWVDSPPGHGVDTEFWLNREHWLDEQSRVMLSESIGLSRLPELPMLHNERWFRDILPASAYAICVTQFLQTLSDFEFAGLIRAGTSDLRELPFKQSMRAISPTERCEAR